MGVLVWVVEGTWPWCVDAARDLRTDGDVTLLYVARGDVEALPHGALAGLLGRGRHHAAPDPARASDGADDEDAAGLLAEASERLGRPARTLVRHGRVEREVVAVAEGMDLLVVARDGDRSRLGPRSLGPDTRFVVDHAPCPVLLVWPGETPAVADIPPPPEHPPDHPPDHHPRPPHRREGRHR